MSEYPNETVKTIMERRSVRKFKPRQITDRELDAIIECGLWAPSARNTQNWHFTVMQNSDLISWTNSEIKKNLPPDVIAQVKKMACDFDNFSVFYNAPTVILVSGEDGDRFAEVNCGLAAENMFLAAQSVGVASIAIGWARLLLDASEADVVRKRYGIPDGYRILYAVCLGYADEVPEPPKRKEGKVSRIR